jgi:site-specific recombinase XerD
MTTPLKLPPFTHRFLRTRPHRRVRLLVYVLHRWLDRQRLTLAELTPAHVRRFLVRPGRVRIAKRVQANYRNQLRGYLKWLYDRGLVGFVPAPRRRRPYELPATAREYLASLAPTHRHSTCHRYIWSLRKFHAWLEAHELEIHRLTRFELAPWFHALHASGLRPVSRSHILFEVRAYLLWLSEQLPMRTAPYELIRTTDIPKLPQYLPRPLTAAADHELQRRLAVADEPGAWALLLMRRTGLRIGELRSLEYHCIRPDEQRPLLKVPLGKLNSERLVPLAPDTVELIRRLRSVGARPRAWLVPGDGGAQMSYGRIRRLLAIHSRDLADPVRITSHRLRHTYATEMLSAGMSLPGVMRLLGHRDHHMTLRYTAITPETVSSEYGKALAQLATKYQLPAPTPIAKSAPEIGQILDDLSRWLRKHAPSAHHLRSLLKRVERLRRDVQRLMPSMRHQP